LLEAPAESRFEALYVVAIYTGLRRGELLGLRGCADRRVAYVSKADEESI
jgi:integrase